MPRSRRKLDGAELFKVWATLLGAVSVAAVLTAAALATGAQAQEAGCTGQVVLDAGHAGCDSGVVNAKYGLVEKEQTLDVARRLETLLEVHGNSVCMTRTRDETLSNNDRYAYANTTRAKVLVSVRMNGSSDPGTNYTTTLSGKWRKDKELAHAVFDGLSTLPAAGGAGTMRTRTPYSFASGVLLKSDMPATIAETVFITSEAEGRLLSDSTGARQQIARALKIGIEDYLAIH